MLPQKDNTLVNKSKNILIALCDVAIMVLSLVLTKTLLMPSLTMASSIANYGNVVVLSVLSFLSVVIWKPSIVLRPFVRVDEVEKNVFQTILLHLFVFVAMLSLFGEVGCAPTFLLVFYSAFFVFLCTEKLVILQIVKKKRTKSSGRRHVVLVGPSCASDVFLYDSLIRNAEIMVDGFFSANEVAGQGGAMPWLGECAQVSQYLDEHPEVQSLYCCHEYVSETEILQLFQCCENRGVAFFALPASLNVLPFRIRIEKFGELDAFGLIPFPLQCWANRFVKRLFDLLLSLVFMITVFPILYLVVFIVLKRKSPGPVFVRQKHVGANGQPFETFVFRTDHMPASLVGDEAKPFAFGCFLHRTKIHRLPMLVNVLMGDMSLVGPSLSQADDIAAGEGFADKYMKSMKPGLTGWAQIQKQDSESGDFEERTKRENLWYAQNWNFWLDVYIIVHSLKKKVTKTE